MPPTRDPRIPELISTTDAGEILGVSRDAARLLYENGRLPGAAVGRNVVFRPSIVSGFAETYKIHERTTRSQRSSDVGGTRLSAAQRIALSSVTAEGVLTLADHRVIMGLVRRGWVEQTQVDGEQAWRITVTGRTALDTGDIPGEKVVRDASGDIVEPVRDPNIPELMTATEAGAARGVSRAAISSQYLQGRLPGVDVGHVVVFRAALIRGDAEDDDRRDNLIGPRRAAERLAQHLETTITAADVTTLVERGMLASRTTRRSGAQVTLLFTQNDIDQVAGTRAADLADIVKERTSSVEPGAAVTTTAPDEGMTIPQRDALASATRRGVLTTGDHRVIMSLVRRGWVERSPGRDDEEVWRITKAGRAALRTNGETAGRPPRISAQRVSRQLRRAGYSVDEKASKIHVREAGSSIAVDLDYGSTATPDNAVLKDTMREIVELLRRPGYTVTCRPLSSGGRIYMRPKAETSS